MQLVSVLVDGKRNAGILDGERVFVTDVPGLDTAVREGMQVQSMMGYWHPLSALRLDAPLRPPVVFCTGQNYRDHLAEKAPITLTEPEFFLKAGQTIAMPDAPCTLDPVVTTKLDYETELGVIIGKSGRNIPASQALEYVFGYLVVNDLTARDRQVVVQGEGRFAMALGPGKNFDGATRFAPWVVTADAVSDPQHLGVITHVNGEIRQNNATRNMIFNVAEIITFLSRLMTLYPGTVIATGTPGGTGWGQDPTLGGTRQTPPGCVPARYLAAGDYVESEIEQVGRLVFTVVDPA
jgi:2-keto-4-pentenoate hydratase/2-oxohepta-3-ene-1,7-dioic acid hydratase in catechol pathway